jgi:hypothetical protein
MNTMNPTSKDGFYYGLLRTKGKDIVFRFITEYYSSLNHFGPQVIIIIIIIIMGLFLYEDF